MNWKQSLLFSVLAAGILTATGLFLFPRLFYPPPTSEAQAGLDPVGLDGLTRGALRRAPPKTDLERENRDLAAQEATVTLSYWMLLAVILQTLVAAAALAAFWFDFRQSRRSAEAQLRAYVKFDDWQLQIAIPSETLPVTCRYDTEYSNAGQTPAYDCRVQAALVALEAETAELVILRSWAQRGDPVSAPVTLSTGEKAPVQIHTAGMSLDHWKRVCNRELTLYAFGWVIYEDVFGGSHCTRFCRYLTGNLPAPDFNGTSKAGWAPALFFNDSD